MITESAGVEIAGTRLRQLRKLAGFNLKPFATLAGCSPQYVSQLELGTRQRASPELFARICDVLGLERTRRHELVDKPGAAEQRGES
jgi:transcriptional regulator with XRE-family HTH domain